MPSFDAHISQNKRNLNFLGIINEHAPDHPDWQVTVCFYSALHLVNAHLAYFGLHFRNHNDVEYRINFENQTSPAKLPEKVFIAYKKLRALSRRARYLVNEKGGKQDNETVAFTYDKHLARAGRHLDTILQFFQGQYNLHFNTITLQCSELKKGECHFISVSD